MRIKVISGGPQAWYNQSIGLEFEAWENEAFDDAYFIDSHFLVLKIDAVITYQTENEKRRKIKTN